MNTKSKHPKTAFLFENTAYAHYNKQIRNAAQYYCLAGMRITPHGARLGKAVETFNTRVSLEDIALEGRWARVYSAVDYIKNGQASLAKLPMSSFVQREIRREEKLYRTLVNKQWQKMHGSKKGKGEGEENGIITI